MRFHHFLPTLLLLTLLCTSGRAQKAITIPDMQTWNVIDDEEIGADGRFVLYTLTKDVGDPIAVVYDGKTKTERRFPRLHRARLSYDGQHLIGLLKPGMATVKALKLSEKKKAKDKLAKMDSLLVWHLTEPEPRIIPRVYDFKTGERWSGRYAYTTDSTLPDSLQKGLDKDAHRLLVRSFSTPDSFYLEGVKSFLLARDAAVVLAHQTAKDSSWKAGILRLADDLQWQTLSSDEGDYTALALSNDGSQAAFLTANKEAKDAQKPFHLHHWQGDDRTAEKLTGEALDWMPQGSRISDDRTPEFSDNGDYLFFGTTPRRPERDTNLLDEEIADVEIWTTDDDRMYTEENLRLRAEEKRTFLAVYRTKANSFLQLGTPDRPYDYQPNDLTGHYVMVYDDRPYSKETMWEGGPGARNTTVVDLRTGERKAMLDGQVTPARWLEGGKYLVWYNQTDTTWNSFDAANGQAHVLTTNATGVFYDEINDRPMHPSSYGYQGTLSGGNKFLVADRYDLWQLDPAGKEKPVRLTKGREKNIRYFLQDLDPENRFIDPSEKVLAATFHQDTYHEGYGWLKLTDGSFTSLRSGPKNFGDFAKARSAEQYLYTRSDFREFPDLRLTGDMAKEGTRISQANPQQKDFAWGTNETYEWTDLQGRTLKGQLVKPDNFDPNKKYPLMVNYYERSSERVYRHQTPLVGRSSINYSHYVSKGYVIFNPDVVYRIGYPGESAYDCVMSGLTSLLAEGFIDKERIGMQGHSWGGYQAAYLVTKTDLFAAVESGAPVVNMFSAYGGIRWGSGRSRQFQYEHTQSRIGGTPWSHFQRYYENSPLFTTDKINTPLLILHNDHDSAVPWEQGIEWFTALRRLGKPAWMLNYRGEPHWPLKTANRADFQTRMAAFFDHYLMGEPMPMWMAEGVKPIERAKGLD
ncbi:alpha/beta hydrolase family protein [Neolewinella persica]|uniref:alpha/beta hydrolase family protein n=1 Tax=Neolewinella persica TaxID=70998 RepID=UPI00035EBDC3|nr:prolyl oligopeptidase family serine peptidase [Neolewinella persica]